MPNRPSSTVDPGSVRRPTNVTSTTTLLTPGQRDETAHVTLSVTPKISRNTHLLHHGPVRGCGKHGRVTTRARDLRARPGYRRLWTARTVNQLRRQRRRAHRAARTRADRPCVGEQPVRACPRWSAGARGAADAWGPGDRAVPCRVVRRCHERVARRPRAGPAWWRRRVRAARRRDRRRCCPRADANRGDASATRDGRCSCSVRTPSEGSSTSSSRW